jgi:hypothetical protein
MPGHVFVVKGDVTRIACDAWLLPGGPDPRPEPDWLEGVPGAHRITWPEADEAWRREERRARAVEGWSDDAPLPWVVNVGPGGTRPIAWYVEGAAEFLERAAAALRWRHPRYGRARPLVALPVVGTGRGGARHAAGEVVRELLPMLARAARTYALDVALVAREEAAFAAAQAERRRATALDPWRELDDRLRSEADRLGDHAATGRLVLFIGGGVARGAGLPLWGEMLDRLAQRAGMSSGEREALSQLDPLDRARLIGKRLQDARLGGVRAPLGSVVAELLGAHRHHSLSHALLAALPVEEVVTTNYDLLFEQASAAAGFPVRVLPERPRREDRRWLLKMHGSIDRPEEIVLTREDYLRYEERRAALSGIVQALLIMRHMLFVGFALRDPNFHRISDAVRKAFRPAADDAKPDRFGTALVLRENQLQRELWEGDLHWTAMCDEGEAEAGAARRLEIFLDCVLAHTSSSSYLLHPAYAAVLSPPERALAHALGRFAGELAPEARRAHAWARVARMLASLGSGADGD